MAGNREFLIDMEQHKDPNSLVGRIVEKENKKYIIEAVYNGGEMKRISGHNTRDGVVIYTDIENGTTRYGEYQALSSNDQIVQSFAKFGYTLLGINTDNTQ